jgi:polyisoprenoid-binding protein YceI
MKYCLSLVILLASVWAFAQVPQWVPVDGNSKVRFKVKNFGFTVEGSFKGLKGTIAFDPSDLSTAKFDVTVDAATIGTDNDMRDDHLRSDSYFDVKAYPRIRFVSAKVTPTNKAGILLMFGQLEIKGVTREISFPFAASVAGEGYVFKGGFKINRKDFKIGGSSTISDNVDVNLEVATKK